MNDTTGMRYMAYILAFSSAIVVLVIPSGCKVNTHRISYIVEVHNVAAYSKFLYVSVCFVIGAAYKNPLRALPIPLNNSHNNKCHVGTQRHFSDKHVQITMRKENIIDTLAIKYCGPETQSRIVH